MSLELESDVCDGMPNVNDRWDECTRQRIWTFLKEPFGLSLGREALRTITFCVCQPAA